VFSVCYFQFNVIFILLLPFYFSEQSQSVIVWPNFSIGTVAVHPYVWQSVLWRLQQLDQQIPNGSFHTKSTSTIHHSISDCLVIFFLDSIHRDMLLLIFFRILSQKLTDLWLLNFVPWRQFCKNGLIHDLWNAILSDRIELERWNFLCIYNFLCAVRIWCCYCC